MQSKFKIKCKLENVKPSGIYFNKIKHKHYLSKKLFTAHACIVVLSWMAADWPEEKKSLNKSLFLFSLQTKGILVAS